MQNEECETCTSQNSECQQCRQQREQWTRDLLRQRGEKWLRNSRNHRDRSRRGEQ